MYNCDKNKQTLMTLQPYSSYFRRKRQGRYVSVWIDQTKMRYDYRGNATSIRQTGSAIDEIFAEFDYNANGLLTSTRRYEGAENDYTLIAESLLTYNANNAVTSITHNNSSGTEIVKHSYAYDSTNNIVEYLNSLDGSTSYDYDFLGQLISADYANATISDESYSYDSNGNRLTANGSTYTTSTNNELTSDGTWSYTYDDEGNRISKTNSTNTERELYTWDYRNRLTSVTKQEFNAETQEWTTVQIVEYTYDYNNVWIRKIIGNEKTIFIPENYQTTVQIDNNTITHHYLWTPNTQDKLLADVTNTEILWSLTDHLGTVRDIIQSTTTGIVTQAHVIYDAYGNIISCKNSEGQTVDNPLLFAYTGKAFDTSTFLQNNINRWYDATIGRWLSQDPIGFEGNDTNLYRYISNNSLNYIDVYGLAICDKLLGQAKLILQDNPIFKKAKKCNVKFFCRCISKIPESWDAVTYPQNRKHGITIYFQKSHFTKDTALADFVALFLHELYHASRFCDIDNGINTSFDLRTEEETAYRIQAEYLYPGDTPCQREWQDWFVKTYAPISYMPGKILGDFKQPACKPITRLVPTVIRKDDMYTITGPTTSVGRW